MERWFGAGAKKGHIETNALCAKGFPLQKDAAAAVAAAAAAAVAASVGAAAAAAVAAAARTSTRHLAAK